MEDGGGDQDMLEDGVGELDGIDDMAIDQAVINGSYDEGNNDSKEEHHSRLRDQLSDSSQVLVLLEEDGKDGVEEHHEKGQCHLEVVRELGLQDYFKTRMFWLNLCFIS